MRDLEWCSRHILTSASSSSALCGSGLMTGRGPGTRGPKVRMSLSIRSVLELVCDDDVGFVEFPVLEMPGVMTVMELMERRSSDLTSRRRLHASWLMMFASAIAGEERG